MDHKGNPVVRARMDYGKVTGRGRLLDVEFSTCEPGT